MTDLQQAAQDYVDALDRQRHEYRQTARNAPTEQEMRHRKQQAVARTEQALREALTASYPEDAA